MHENCIFFLPINMSIYTRCGVPAFLAAQHTTVRLDVTLNHVGPSDKDAEGFSICTQGNGRG